MREVVPLLLITIGPSSSRLRDGPPTERIRVAGAQGGLDESSKSNVDGTFASPNNAAFTSKGKAAATGSTSTFAAAGFRLGFMVRNAIHIQAVSVGQDNSIHVTRWVRVRRVE